MTVPAVDAAWRRYRRWARVARAGRKRIRKWRQGALILLVVGALLGALPSLPGWPPDLTPVTGILAALALAAAGGIQLNFLNADQMARWTKARATAEGLKAEIYRFCAGVAPYTGADRDAKLNGRVDELTTGTTDLAADVQRSPPDTRPLPEVHDIASYVVKRAEAQRVWHADRILDHTRRARNLRLAEFAATAVGAVLSAVSAALKIDLAAWIAASTTIAAAVSAHAAAARHDKIAASYAVTTDHLERLIERLPAEPDPRAAAEFVVAVERVLAAQNEGWVELIEAP
jgi:hypothetical protein